MPEIDDLPDKPGHLIRLAQQRSAATFAKAARRHNITGVQHIIMVALNKYPDIDLSTLAGIVALDRSTTGAVVARLGERGIVEVEPSPSDRRAKLIRLSASGQALLERMLDAVARSQRDLLAPLDDAERELFFRIMRKLVARPTERRLPVALRADRAGSLKGLRALLIGGRNDLGMAIGRRLSDDDALVAWSNGEPKQAKAGRAGVDLAIFARLWPGEGDASLAALGRQLDDDVGRARALAAKPAPGLRILFALVLAVADGVLDERLAAGLKHAWMLAVRQAARDLRRQGIGCCGVVAAPPVNGSRRAAKVTSDLLLTVEQASHLVALAARGIDPTVAGVILDQTDIE
jgi:DNA-binding MarR family transcriptional regulator